jgi:hypothetical protein
MKKKETQWFSHESTTHTSAQMLAMMEKYKATGYGCWWILVEILRQQDDYRYDISKKYSLNSLTRAMQISKARVEQFIADCIQEYDLLQSDGEYIWSDALIERMQHLEEKKAILRERGRKGGLARAANDVENNDEETYDETLDNTEGDATCATPVLKQNEAHNTTQHNTTAQKNSDEETKQNNTKQNNDDDDRENEFQPRPPQQVDYSKYIKGVLEPIGTLKDRLLADETLIGVFASMDITRQEVTYLLQKFNTYLQSRQVNEKEMADYRKHFSSWMRHQDLTYMPQVVNTS